MLVVYEVLLVYEPSGGTCIYSPAFVWDDVTAIVYTCRCIHTVKLDAWKLNFVCPWLRLVQ